MTKENHKNEAEILDFYGKRESDSAKRALKTLEKKAGKQNVPTTLYKKIYGKKPKKTYVTQTPQDRTPRNFNTAYDADHWKNNK